jgi:ribonuclease HII
MSLAWPAQPGVAGVDEAGRGPLAGPVVAAAVILPAEPVAALAELDDSKRLRAGVRERLAVAIGEHAVAVGLGWADAAEIDALNILEASHLAMRRALLGLRVAPSAVRVDGNRLPSAAGLGFTAPFQAVIGGDRREAAIAAASILAKTWRDAWMVAADARWPGYGFAAHKGYGTRRHLSALASLGTSPLHRQSFEPVRSASAPRDRPD